MRGQATGAAELDETIWALKDVSFEIKQGEVVGIIGRNGAGKSTLLKILSRITEPTKGFVEIHGRVGSLLEVGTGFHPELTGRENIYLNGAILGMKRVEIDKKFDEIVAFAEVEKFIDTPVKHYSSGMFLRLAFAVAAHLEPEILLVDEVLTVGDIEFQKKCIGKMSSVAKEGRTVLFVSHNMGAVTRLCSRTLWIEEGKLRLDGLSFNVVSSYISSGTQEAGLWIGKPAKNLSERKAWLKYAKVLSVNEEKISTLFHYDEPVKIELTYEIKSRVKSFRSYIFLRDSSGNIVWASHDTDGTNLLDKTRDPGIYCSTCIFPERLLRPGWYHVSIGIYGKPREAIEEEYVDAMSFQISEAGYTFSNDPRMGIVTPYIVWTITCHQKEKDSAMVLDQSRVY
ncbi:MAG: ABC transporter ATP-binding protein [bacterium]